MKKAFEFIFNGGLEYCLDYIQRWGNTSSLLSNIGHYGIRGSQKFDIDIDDLVSTIINDSYAPYFFIIKNANKYNLLYLWDDSGKNGDNTPRKNMQSNSLWVFTILKELTKGIIIKTDIKRGYDVSVWVKKVSDMQNYVDNHKGGDRALPGSTYIRIKVTASRHAIYEIYKKHYNSVIKDLDLLGIEYKIIE